MIIMMTMMERSLIQKQYLAKFQKKMRWRLPIIIFCLSSLALADQSGHGHTVRSNVMMMMVMIMVNHHW